MLFQYWPTACGAGPTLKQHWIKSSCLLGHVVKLRRIAHVHWAIFLNKQPGSSNLAGACLYYTKTRVQ